jgi:hypothetical protein
MGTTSQACRKLNLTDEIMGIYGQRSIISKFKLIGIFNPAPNASFERTDFTIVQPKPLNLNSFFIDRIRRVSNVFFFFFFLCEVVDTLLLIKVNSVELMAVS